MKKITNVKNLKKDKIYLMRRYGESSSKKILNERILCEAFVDSSGGLVATLLAESVLFRTIAHNVTYTRKSSFHFGNIKEYLQCDLVDLYELADFNINTFKLLYG